MFTLSIVLEDWKGEMENISPVVVGIVFPRQVKWVSLIRMRWSTLEWKLWCWTQRAEINTKGQKRKRKAIRKAITKQAQTLQGKQEPGGSFRSFTGVELSFLLWEGWLQFPTKAMWKIRGEKEEEKDTLSCWERFSLEATTASVTQWSGSLI